MRKLISCLIGFFLALSLASAVDFDIKSNSSFIDDNYLGGDIISGVLNMSFDGQENSYFTNNINNQKIRLLEVLNAMNFTQGRDYSCDPMNCQSYYLAINPELGKEISLDDEKELYGFRIKEENKLIRSVEDLTFSVDVFANIDCYNQIYIDLFDDGSVEFYNMKPYLGNGSCGTHFYPEKKRNEGCFDEEEVTRQVPIGEDYYCELMKDIPPAASYEIGGDIIVKEAGGSISFVMYPVEGGDEWLGWGGYDNLPVFSGAVGVIVNYSSLEEFDALVCVYTKGQYANDYFEIQVNEDDDEICGLVFTPGDEVSEESFEIDYDLYIKPRGYAAIDTVVFDKELYEETTGRRLKDDLTDYINETYGMNCSGDNGCVIPFSIWGRSSEGQAIYDVDLKYKYGSGAGTTFHEDEVYEVREKPAKVSSDWLKIKVEKMDFKVPDEDGKHTFRLFLGGEEVIDEIIDVEIGFAFELAPRFAYIGRETAFTANSAANITSSIWDFGDGTTPITVLGTSARHLYDEAGEYFIKVTLIKAPVGTAAPKNSTKRFKVVVGDAKESADLTLKDYEARIVTLESDINNYPTWVKTVISTAIGLDTKKTLIQTKRQAYNNLGANSTEDDYIAIIYELLNLDLPNSIYTSSSGVLPGDIGYGKADMTHVLEIAGTTTNVSDMEDLKSKVFGWMAEYYGLSVSFETISAEGDSQDIEILKKYKIEITEKKDPGTNPAYLIIPYPKNGLVFSSQADLFSETSISGGTYTDVNLNEISSAEFLIVGASAPSIINLGAYISPAPERLGIDTRPIKKCWLENCDPEGNFLWGRFLIGIGIILLLFLIVYIILQSWYKRNYERHLFPNSNDLYNLLNFIYNSRRNGLKDSDIKGSLRNRKWTSEQITYAFRKLEGKRTGMWEIPIFKFAENKKVRKELEKQQGGRPLDIRFIKRPNL
jgi:hypothetical protein